MTTKKKYTVHVTFSADTSYEVEAEDEDEALELGGEFGAKEYLSSLEFTFDAHCAEEGWDEEPEEVEDPR